MVEGAGMRAILALAVAVGLLAACGKKGPPDPPGPPDKIIYPKAYPTH
jgi:predicted small lipoprotein YifL